MMNHTQLMRDKKIKVTPQRLSVCKALQELGHASVEEVTEEVSKMNPTITTATVYNVLSCLADNNIIARLSTPSGKMHYDISTHKHHHIIMEDGRITDYESSELTEIVDGYFKRNPIIGYDIEKINLLIFGNPISAQINIKIN